MDIISLEVKVVALGLQAANQRGLAARHHDMGGETTSQEPATEYDKKQQPGE